MKNSIFIVILFALLIMTVLIAGCERDFGGSETPTTEAAPPGGDPLPFETFRFHTQGMSAEAEVVEGERTKDGGLRLSYQLERSYYDGEKDIDEKDVIREVTGDAAFYDEISALLGNYGVASWDGFEGQNPPGFLDGESGGFDAVLSDGSTISAYGSNNFPKFFGTVMRKLQDRVQYEELSGTHIVLSTFSVDVPESWPGVMTLYHGTGYEAFETALDGGLKATLIIDNDPYGYADSYNTAFRAGRLVKEGEEDRYVTVRESYRMENYEDFLSPEQKAVSNTFTDARAAITASIAGANGWTFLPEDGSTLYEPDARKLFDQARSLWLDLCLAGEYAGGGSPETIDGREYRKTFLPYTGLYVRNEEELREEMEKYFSEEFTERILREKISSKEIVFEENAAYSAFKVCADPGRYGGYSLEEVTNEAIVVEIMKALPTDEQYRYSGEESIIFPVAQNKEGRFVFTEFPYWDKGEWK